MPFYALLDSNVALTVLRIFTDKTEISNIIVSPKFTAFKYTQKKKFLDFTSENKECYNEPFTFDELLQSLHNSHDTAVGSNQIHYKILKHLPSKSKDYLLHIFKKFLGKVVNSLCPGHIQLLYRFQSLERTSQIQITTGQ